MYFKKRFGVILFTIIFSLFISLLFVAVSNAGSPVINGSNQMHTGGTQTLTVTGGRGPYTWSQDSGGGNLSGTTGDSTTYTAPASNSNCMQNATICVTDSCGQKTCMQIATSSSSVIGDAYYKSYNPYLTPQVDPNCRDQWPNNTYDCTCKQYATRCLHVFCGITEEVYDCRGNLVFGPCQSGSVEMGCVPCASEGCYDKPLNQYNTCGFRGPVGYTINQLMSMPYLDVRTTAQKAAGCCPAQLLPPLPPPPPPPPPPCDLQISNFTASPETIDRNGGVIHFSATITPSQGFTWILTVDGAQIGSGSSSPVSVDWNIKDQFAKLKEPVTVKAILSVVSGSNTCDNYTPCTVTANKNITITAREKVCNIKIPANSSIDITSGNLSHTQTLFTVPNSRLMSDFTLTYNSTDGYKGVLSTGWTHTYNIFLTADPVPANDTYVLMDGSGDRISLYKNGGYYTSDMAVYPMLLKNADNTFTLTYKNGTVYTFNAQGKLTAIADKNGNAVSLAYNGINNLATISDLSGKKSI